MYSKIAAILINTVFGFCLSYTVIAAWFALASNFVTELRFVAEFSLYNIVWLMSDIAYNRRRYQKQGGGIFFWLSAVPVPVLIFVVLMGVIRMLC